MVKYKAKGQNLYFYDELSSLASFKESEDAACMVVQELVDNGLAEIEDGMYRTSFEAIYTLPETDLKLLGLPEYYEHYLYIKPNGLLKEKTFTYKVIYCKSKNGDRYKVTRNGGFIEYNGKLFLLSSFQYKLVETISNFNVLPEEKKTLNNNLIIFDTIKTLAPKAKTALDKYLVNENVYVPKKIRVSIEREGEGSFGVKPGIDIPQTNQFTHYFDQLPQVPDNIPVTTEGNGRIRVVLSDKQRETLKGIKEKYRHTRKDSPEVCEFVNHPEEFLDPESCDLSDFYSDRVIEIGLYRPKFTSFESPYKSSWIPEFVIEDRINGTTHLKFRNELELETFDIAIDEAQKREQCYLDFKGVMLNVEDAKEISNRAHETFHKKRGHKEPSTEDKKVLIIEDNEEELGYKVDLKLKDELNSLVLKQIPGLRSHIQLKSHQQEGVAWLQYLISNGYKGCLLADDMGLGKTLQLLSIINWHWQNFSENDLPYLIVAPISLLENWENEYSKFFDERIKVFLATGNSINGVYNKGLDKNLIKKLQNKQIVLTNYETIRSYQFSFCAVDFAVTILDEAQRVKTPGTMITNAVKALKSEFKVAMTGTPVENTLIDLWCIMDFSVPGLLGNCKQFAQKYKSPMRNPDTDLVELGNNVRREMGRYFMRRLKTDVAKDLPRKSIERIPCKMTEIQRNAYVDTVNEAITLKNSEEPPKGYMLTCLQKLREISDHPYLSDSSYVNLTTDELVNSSAKLQATLNILTSISQKGEKAIVFTDRKEMQRLMQKVINKKFGLSPRIINGDTLSISNLRSTNNGNLSRQQAIDDFQDKDGFNVIIMSPIAAGMGLNVTGANHVIHYSRHWNPAKEEQATDRAYRIGQKKDVFVYYPMAITDGISTFDETLDNLLSKKTALASATLFPTERTEVKSEDLFKSLIG